MNSVAFFIKDNFSYKRVLKAAQGMTKRWTYLFNPFSLNTLDIIRVRIASVV